MATKIEFYQRLSQHIPEEAARLIAEEMLTESQLATKQDLARLELATKEGMHDLALTIEKVRTSMFRWNLVFFVPLWIGVYATLVAILFRGSP